MTEPARKQVRLQEWPSIEDFREAMDSFSHRLDDLAQRIRGLEEEVAEHLALDDREDAEIWDRIEKLERIVKSSGRWVA